MVQANCRAQFTADDFSFVVRVLAKSPRDAVSLVDLLSSETERDAVLDHDLIYDSVVDQADCLRVSAAFYFYIVTRRVLRRASLTERELTDYVAALLLDFSHVRQLIGPGNHEEQGSRRGFGYVSDVLKKMQQATPEQAYALQTHLANYTLFLSGIFAERVHAHAQRRGAPGISFYEAVGQSSYQSVARHPQSRRCQLDSIYEQLGSEFRRVRLALNDLAETLFHLHETPSILLHHS